MKTLYALALCCFWAATSPLEAGPLYDPFLENFQVGAFADAEDLATAYTYPAGLLAPARVDTIWTRAALRALGPNLPAKMLARAFLERNLASDQAAAIITDQVARIRELTTATAKFSGERSGWLAYEQAVMDFTRAVGSGHLRPALEIANRLGEAASPLKQSNRALFVWQLRRDLLAQLTDAKPASGAQSWPTMFKLGPYDFSNAWALWVAHCRDLKTSPLHPSWHTRQQAQAVAGLRRSWVTPEALAASAFSGDLQAGLGARLFKDADLTAHLQAHAKPPSGFSEQGWWVAGQRSSRRGEAGFYETLAGRSDLRPGWRMDVWRRASEIHLLGGRWSRGLPDLDHALALAANGSGTESQRRRLWQWTEQAAVLAMVQGDPQKGQRIINRGLESFTGDDLAAFKAEIQPWLSPDEASPDGIQAQAAHTVVTGRADDLVRSGSTVRRNLELAAGKNLWRLWARWGQSLCQRPDLDFPAGKQTYHAGLTALLNSSGDTLSTSAVLDVIFLRTSQGLALADLFSILLDHDVQLLSDGKTSPALSLMPALSRELKGHWLDLHALLGLSLAANDMRGGVALTYYLPTRSLTEEERLLFLYPLPAAGSLQDALLQTTIDPLLIMAVARNESLFEPSIRSRAGALGWMQIMPFHFPARGARPGPDYWGLPPVSVAKGDQLLEENRRRYQGNPYLVLAAYNAGPGAASRWLKQLGGQAGNDQYLAWIGYPETRHYVEKVLIDREIYDWILAVRR